MQLVAETVDRDARSRRRSRSAYIAVAPWRQFGVVVVDEQRHRTVGAHRREFAVEGLIGELEGEIDELLAQDPVPLTATEAVVSGVRVR